MIMLNPDSRLKDITTSLAVLFFSLSLFVQKDVGAQNKQNLLIAQGGVMQQTQEDYINITIADLKKTNNLSISKTNNLNQGSITGQISINGKKIRDLAGNQTNLNLSPHLKKGENKIEVRGQYSPSNSAIKIAFSGGSTSISQVTSGAGKINYNLIIDVE